MEILNAKKDQENGFFVNGGAIYIQNRPGAKFLSLLLEWETAGGVIEDSDPAPVAAVPFTAGQIFDATIDGSTTLKAVMDELEVGTPGLRAAAKARAEAV